MKYQSGPGMCGAAATVNVLRALGIKVRESTVAQHAGTTVAAGTTEHGLRQALTRFECGHELLVERKYSVAEDRLIAHLRQSPAIVLSESGDHWVSAIGMLGDRVIIFDSQNYAWNKSENGVHMIQRGDSLRRYWLPCEGKRWAILVKPPV